MDVVLIVLVIAIVIVGLFFKDFKSVVYFIGIIDIFFRLLHKLISLIDIKAITDFVVEYIPGSVEAIINNYSTGILNIVLIWVLFLLYCYFEFYLIKYWVKKKK
jgi:mannitol-specific phosphotransferase system IIBC component